MAEGRGQVKLFGKTIPVPKGEGDVAVAPVQEPGGGGGDEVTEALEDHSSTGAETRQEDPESPRSKGQSGPQTSSSTGSDNNYKGSSADQESPSEKDPKPAEEPNNPPERSVKKPDKILPCPRCNSMDTKFCYYNNYNVNQPRHFCKNCQRYWTAGGTMRNVPVGAGRRKNKRSASHYRHITVAKAALQSVHPDITKLVHHAELKPNGTVLSCATDRSLSESMSSVLNLAEKTTHGYIRNGLHHPEEHVAPFPCTREGVENAEEHSSGSSVTASNFAGDGGVANNTHESGAYNCQGYPPPQVPCFSGTPWPYPWNAAPALCASTFPISFYPMTAYWGCSVPSAWSVSWLAPPSSFPTNGGSAGPAPNSPTLGKHSRDGGVLSLLTEREDASEQTTGERCLWTPKTLRIDDPEEVAKSSIWVTKGFNKNDKASGINRGLFRAFNQPKAGISNCAAETPKFLHANPAALSRSLKFQESS